MITRITVTLALLCTVVTSGCTKSRPSTAGTDGATHFLVACDSSAECGPLSCLCGVCSKGCDDDAQCTSLDDGASCAASSAAECGVAKRTCTLECEDNGDCDAFGSGARCEGGRCVRSADPDVDGGMSGKGGSAGSAGRGGSSGSSGGGSGSGATSGGGNAGSADSDACRKMDAQSSGRECLRLEGYSWNGVSCEEVNCGCVGADCASIYPTEAACEDAHQGCAVPCRKMDARSDGTECARVVGHSWNGVTCREVLCGCTGSDCDAIYPSQSDCMAAFRECPSLRDCTKHSECIVTGATCCQSCATERDEIVPVAKASSADAFDRFCEAPLPCPMCTAQRARMQARYLPVCGHSPAATSQCAMIDLAEVSCTPEVGCRVRARGCCECGADVAVANLIAVPNSPEIPRETLCDSDQACDDCLPVYPADVTARCGASGHCELLQNGTVVGP